MDNRWFGGSRETTTDGLSRRVALGRLAGGGAAAALLGAVGLGRRQATAQGAATEQLEFDLTPQNPVSITRAGSGPPQRGDTFYIDGPIYAVGDVGGSQVGTYQCFGFWTHAADDTDAPNQRLTTIQVQLEDGAIMALANEGGANHNDLVGAVQGGTGRYVGATGTIQQPILPAAEATTPEAVPAVPGTPTAAQVVVRLMLDLTLPSGGA